MMNKKVISCTPSTLLFLICVLWLNGGIIRFTSFFNATFFLAVFFAGAFFAVVEYSNDSIASLKKSGLLYGCLFLVTIIPTSLIIHNALESEMIKVLYAVILLSIQLYLRKKPLRAQKLFVFAILLDCIAINIKTIISLAVSGELSRIYASGADAVLEAGYDIYLLGGYGYIYSLVFLIPFVFIKKDSMKNLTKIQKTVLFVFVITGILTIVEAQYTIAILILAAGILLSLITQRGVNAKTVLLSVFIGVILMILGTGILESLISSGIFGSVVENRFSQIIDLFSGNLNPDGDLAFRFRLYMQTIEYLPKCFLFGTYETMLDARSALGWHSEWLDRLARFGVIRYSIFIAFLVKSIRYSLPKIDIQSRYFILIMSIIITGIINPVLTSNFYLTMFILVPFIFAEEQEQSVKVAVI